MAFTQIAMQDNFYLRIESPIGERQMTTCKGNVIKSKKKRHLNLLHLDIRLKIAHSRIAVVHDDKDVCF